MKRKAAGNLGAVVESVNNPLTVIRRLRDWHQELKMGKHAEKLAEVITSPDAMKKLKALRMLSPRDRKARIIAMQVLTQTAAGAANDPADVPRGGLSPSSASPPARRPEAR